MENKKEKSRKKLTKKQKRLIAILCGVLAIIIASVTVTLILVNKEDKVGEVSTISKSSLEKVVERAQLSTLEYTYNAIVSVKDDKGKIKYHVAYEGVVKVGMDFTKIDIDVDNVEKKIKIKIPEMQIENPVVKMEDMEYIFVKEKYETEDVSAEAFNISKEDLKKRTANDESLMQMARENAVSSIRAFIEPWIEQLDAEYTVEIA